MRNLSILVENIIAGIPAGIINEDNIGYTIENSNIDYVCKRGLLSLIEGCSIEKCFSRLLNLDLDSMDRRVAIFEKVSKEQFIDGLVSHGLVSRDDSRIDEWYDNIRLPVRGTRGSAGYDFIAPYPLYIRDGEELVVCTGVRCLIRESWVLKLYPRSSSGTRYSLGFCNGVPVLDSDYYFTGNEGHIMFRFKVSNGRGDMFICDTGEKLCQGVFVEYGITFDDCVTDVRVGGFGSTGR